MKIFLTGGSGLIGGELVRQLALEGHELTLFTHRNAPPGNFKTIQSFDQIGGHESFDIVVNLAGAPIMGSRWSDARKKELISSRVDLTNALVQMLSRLKKPPRLLMSGSAIGIYGDHGDEILTEQGEIWGGFGHELCKAWEQAALGASNLGTRTIILRTGLVVASSGGFLEAMKTPFRLGLGGPLASGNQWMSWISLEDHVRLMRMLMNQSTASGIFNLTAPSPVTNSDFTRKLAALCRRPAVFRLPATLLNLALGEMATLLTESQRVVPARALDLGFDFRHETIDRALEMAFSGP